MLLTLLLLCRVQSRQPVFVLLMHSVYRVSQGVLGPHRVNVENCIKALAEVGEPAQRRATVNLIQFKMVKKITRYYLNRL